MMKAHGKRVIENAVVGIVDIAASTKLANEVDVYTEWQIKELFLEAAQARARETGMLILNNSGDGFLFLANPDGCESWAAGLARFQNVLVSDFNAILARFAAEIGAVDSGIRFGIAVGPVIVGQLPGRSDFLVVGAAISFAARLCASAEIDQMAMSANAWDQFRRDQQEALADMRAYENLKGFDRVVLGFHVNPEGSRVSYRDVRVPSDAVIATAA